uniref:CSS-motif domain-containing protein n=1 Tax=Pseudomaricurvus sp. TaxID=2004510 RepID=UPI003F6AE086
MSESAPNRWPSATLGAVASLLLAGILMIVGLELVRQSQSQQSEALLLTLDQVVKETENSLRRLNEEGLKTCSDENLILMRRTLFQGSFIKDIGFFQ